MADLCEFECGDMREAVEHVRVCDAALYAAHGPSLKGRPCLEVLRQCVRPGGYIIVDDGFLVDGVQSKPPGYEDCLPYDRTVAALTAHGDRLVVEVIVSPEKWHTDDDRITNLIRRRAAELALRHPQAASLLDEYVQIQQRECETLEAIYVPATWLLQRT